MNQLRHNSISNLPVLSYLIQIDSRFFTMTLHHSHLKPLSLYLLLIPQTHPTLSHLKAFALWFTVPEVILLPDTSVTCPPFTQFRLLLHHHVLREAFLDHAIYKQKFLHCSLPPSPSLFLFSILFFNYLNYDMPHWIDCFSPLKLMLHGARTLFILFMQYLLGKIKGKLG